MNKFLKIAGVATLVASFASFAGAASFTNVEFNNGQTTVEGTGGATVTAKLHVVVPVNEVVEQIQTDIVGDGLAPVCTSVGGELGLQQGTHDVSIQVKLPANTGTHNLDVQGSGIFGGFRADDCVGDVVGSASFAGALRVVSSGGSTTPDTTPSWLSAFQAQIAALIAALTPGTGGTPPPTTVNPLCTKVASYGSFSYGMTGSSVVQLQGFLLSEDPNSIPLIRDGKAPFGFFGNQSSAALASFKMSHGCN